jgi:hypothetical protein
MLCVCLSLVTQHAKRMHRIILSSVDLITAQFSGEKKLLNTKYVFLFYLQLLSETFLISKIIKRGIIINVCMPSRKVPVTTRVRKISKSDY